MLLLTGPEKSLVNHVPPVGHSDNQDVVQLVYTVHLGQQLVDDRVVDAGGAGDAAPLLANGVNLVKDDDVEARVGAHAELLLLGVGKEAPNVGLRLANVLVEDLGPVDDLGLARVEHLANLAGHERLARARRSVEQDASHVFAS